MATITVTNLIQGPGTLYVGAYSATAANEPADSAVNLTPAASAWTDLGGTHDGVTLSVDQAYAELGVDQLVDTPGRRQTKRELTVGTNLAEVTLENLARAMNEVVASAITASGNNKVLAITDAPLGGEPNYVALIFDGYSPGGFRRRVFGRRMLSVDPAAVPYKKDAQTLIPVKWASHYVSSTVRPFKVVDQTS